MLSQNRTEPTHIDDHIIETEKAKAIASIAAGLAHELRNPLTIISSTAEYCKEVYENPELQEALTSIMKAADNAERIIRELLNFAKPATDLLEDVVPAFLIKSTAGMIAARARQRQINLVLDLPDDLPVIIADGKRLQQALLNFMLNSIDAMPSGGTLTISAGGISENGLEIQVADTGCGFTSEQMQRLYEPFRTTKSGGVGLGMAVSRNIIKAHNGTIDVESQPGHGACVIIRLPAGREMTGQRSQGACA